MMPSIHVLCFLLTGLPISGGKLETRNVEIYHHSGYVCNSQSRALSNHMCVDTKRDAVETLKGDSKVTSLSPNLEKSIHDGYTTRAVISKK